MFSKFTYTLFLALLLNALSFHHCLIVDAFAESKGKVARWKGPETTVEDADFEEDSDEEESETVGWAVQDKKQESQPKTQPKIAPGMPAPKPNVNKNKDQLVVTYIEPTDKNYTELASVLKETGGIDAIVQTVNETFDFPRIDVVFDLCGQANAFYDSESRRIILCYELVAALADGFRQDSELSDEEVGTQVIASLIFTFFHELGHAAIDVFDLPLMGNEEDAVDRFATLILLSGKGGNEDADLADSAIGSFDLDTAEPLEDLDFSDEHPVDDQRWFTMACLMVGSDPDKYEYLVGENGLPPERAEACPEEYSKMSKSWDTLLEPHLIKS